jgi:hypothetical protein
MGVMALVLVIATLVVVGPLAVLSHFVREHSDEGVVAVASDGKVVQVDRPGHDSHHWHLWMVPGGPADGLEVSEPGPTTPLMLVEHVWESTAPPFPPFPPPRV